MTALQPDTAEKWSQKPAWIRRRHDIFERNSAIVRVLALLIAVLVACSAISPTDFFSMTNFQSMALLVPEVGLLALAMAVAIFTGGLDLSVVAVANLAAYVLAKLLVASPLGGASVLAAVIAALFVGVAVGLANGILVGYVGVTPFLVTLGMMQLVSGLQLGLSNGNAIFGLPNSFVRIGSAAVADIPVTFIGFVLVSIAVAAFFSRGSPGVRLLLIGDNVTAAFFAGIKTARSLCLAYVLSGVLAALAGVFIALQTASASAGYGSSYLLLVIVIVIFGGADPRGGRGSILGVFLSVLTFEAVSSACNVIGLSSYTEEILQGVLLIGALSMDYLGIGHQLRRLRGRRKIPAA